MHPPDFLKGKLSGSYHSGSTLFFQKSHSFRTCHSHLCTGMKMHTRKHLPDHLKHTHILNNHRIQTFLIIWKQIIIQLFRQFPVLQQRIHCQIKFPAMDMSSINGTQKLFLSEILRIGSRAKGCSPHINRICTCTDRCLKSLIGTGRCQKFNLFSSQFYTSRFL